MRGGGSSAAWQRMLGDIGCNPDAGCHSLDLHGRTPLGPASHGAQGAGQGGGDHGSNDRLGNATIDPGSVCDWFQKNDLAFVYLSSSYETEGGGGGANGQKPTYTDAFRPWLEKVRLGGYLAGSGYFLSSGGPTPHTSIPGVSPCHVQGVSHSSSCLCLLHPPLAASAFAYQTPHLHALGGEPEDRFLSGLFWMQRWRCTTSCGPNYLAATCLKYNAGPRARLPSLCECLPALLASVADAPCLA